MKKIMVSEKQISVDMKGAVLGLKKGYIRDQQRDEVFVPKTAVDVYQLTLANSDSKDGLEKLAELCRDVLFEAITANVQTKKQAAEAALFDIADRYGAALRDRPNLFAPETRDALKQQCLDIYQSYVQPQRVCDGDLSYIPRYPLENSEKDPVVTYLAGFAYGYVGAGYVDQEEIGGGVATDFVVEPTSEPGILYRRNAFVESLCMEPSKVSALIMGLSDLPDIRSLEELARATSRIDLFVPIYRKERIARIMQGKKRTPKERLIQNGKIIVRSDWDKTYVDPFIPQAESIIEADIAAQRGKQLQSALAQMPLLQDIMARCGLSESCAAFEEKIITGGVVDWRPLRDALKRSFVSPTQEDRELLEKIIADGIQEDKKINGLRIVTATALGEVALTKDILEADLQRGEVPAETLSMIDAFWVEIAASRDVDGLSDEECANIFTQCIMLYELWNREDAASMSAQMKILVPMLVRAQVRERSQQIGEPQIDKALTFLSQRETMVGLTLDRIDVLRKSLTIDPTLTLAIKTCPSRRPARLLDESKSSFYETNPWRSDAVNLMLATQEIVWFLQDCGITVRVDYIVMGTDERDYLDPIYEFLYGEDGMRPEQIQRRLEQFSFNVKKTAQVSLPTCPVDVRQIEDLEISQYLEPYPASYFKRLDAVAKDIQQDTSPVIKKAMESGIQSYQKRFAKPDGLYAAFSRPNIDFATIARKRMATYSLQMQTILSRYDLLLDTATNPSIDRTAILNREVSKKPSRYGPVSSAYASFGQRDELRKKLYEKTS